MMRFNGEQQVARPVEVVWAALHEREVLRHALPGCEELVPLEQNRYAATLAARVGPVADTYRGSFSIDDLLPGTQLRVLVDGRGRCGRLELDLRVTLAAGRQPGTTALGYVADATVRGFVARLGGAALSVAGAQLTGCFFRDLDRSLRNRVTQVPSVAVG